jgi:hypothetical protein
VLRVFASNGRCPRLSCPRRVSKNNWSKDGDVSHSLANSTMSPPRGRNRSGNRRLPASRLGFWPKWSIGTSPPKNFPLGNWRSAWRPKFASEPADSVRLHGIDGHCNLIGPLAGGAFERPLFKAASAGRNSRQGHPVLACRTHWPIADKVTHNRTPGSQAEPNLVSSRTGRLFQAPSPSLGTAGAGAG